MNTILHRKEWIIGETTVGGAFITLANPGAISWARINADNTITTRTASETRTDLGLGTAATADTGTSGHTIPFLDGANTWSAAQTFSAGVIFSGTGSNITLGSNFLSGDGSDEGISVSSTGQVIVSSLTGTGILQVLSAAGNDAILGLSADGGTDTKEWILRAENSSGDFSIANSNTGNGVALKSTGEFSVDDSLTVGNGFTLTTGNFVLSGTINFPANVRQTFNPGVNNSGFNVGSVAADPGSPVDGDIWYNTVSNTLKCRVGGSTVTIQTA